MIFHIRQSAIRAYQRQFDVAASEVSAHDAISVALRFIDLTKPTNDDRKDQLRRYRVRTKQGAGKLSRGYLVIDMQGSVWDVQPAFNATARGRRSG